MRNIAKRHQRILEQLKIDGYAKVPELSEKLGVSEVTIRKDLKELEKRNLIYRNHGSASLVSTFMPERHIDEKEKIRAGEKRRIAQAAAALLNDKEKIIVASGTTLLAFSEGLPLDKNFTVISSSIKISHVLCYYPNIDVIQLGGTMRKSSESVVGHYADDMLDGLVCNKLFLGVDGIDIDHGLTTSDVGESRVNRNMIRASEEVIVLADSSKFGKRGFSKICDCEQIHHLVTDRDVPAEYVERLIEKDIKVTLV